MTSKRYGTSHFFVQVNEGDSHDQETLRNVTFLCPSSEGDKYLMTSKRYISCFYGRKYQS